MELLSLEIKRNENNEIIDNIQIITNIEDSGINIDICNESENDVIIRYFTKEESKKTDYLEKILGKISILIKEHTKYQCEQYLEENYFYFDEDEFEKIRDTLEEDIDNDIKMQLIIKNKLKDIVGDSKSINLNGFIKFRLKFINPYVARIVEKCIDDYLMKKEYLDFMNIIKYFSESENKKCDEVNVIYNNGKPQIYDGNMKKLNYMTIMEISKELTCNNENYDTNMIDILINISPKRIKIHAKRERINEMVRNTISNIEKIFGDKVMICSGCKFCELTI